MVTVAILGFLTLLVFLVVLMFVFFILILIFMFVGIWESRVEIRSMWSMKGLHAYIDSKNMWVREIKNN